MIGPSQDGSSNITSCWQAWPKPLYLDFGSLRLQAVTPTATPSHKWLKGPPGCPGTCSSVDGLGEGWSSGHASCLRTSGVNSLGGQLRVGNIPSNMIRDVPQSYQWKCYIYAIFAVSCFVLVCLSGLARLAIQWKVTALLLFWSGYSAPILDFTCLGWQYQLNCDLYWKKNWHCQYHMPVLFDSLAEPLGVLLLTLWCSVVSKGQGASSVAPLHPVMPLCKGLVERSGCIFQNLC